MTNSAESGRLLDKLYMAAPCDIGWDNMKGDDRVRFCGACSKSVYNISDMTSREAESFLQEHGISRCMRFYQRKDGTIITDNCPIGLRKLRNAGRKVWRIAASFMAFCLSMLNASAQTVNDGNATSLPRVTNALFVVEPTVIDGQGGWRASHSAEVLPPLAVLVAGREPLVLDEEITRNSNEIAMIVSDTPARGNSGFTSSVRLDVLSPALTAREAIEKAQTYRNTHNYSAANSYYKLVLKYVEYLHRYSYSEKQRVLGEYTAMLELWNKPEEARRLRKELSEEFATSDEGFVHLHIYATMPTPTLSAGQPIPDNE